MISTERILDFGFQWPDSVTRLLPPNSCKRALKCFQSFGECAWMASIMLFRIMVWDVHPIIYLHPTMGKEKVLLPPCNNREEIATSTQSSLQVQRASVASMTPTVNSSDFVILNFFFFGFQPKATRAGDEKHRKKSAWPKYSNAKTRPHQVDLPVELSWNECALRSGNCALHRISSKPLDASSGPALGCAVAAPAVSGSTDRAGDCDRASC